MSTSDVVQPNPDPSEPTERPELDPVATAEIAHLRTALETRDVIGQAKGIIRLLTRVDGPCAFQLLAKISQDCNRRVLDVAALIADCATTAAPLPQDITASWRRRSPATDPETTQPPHRRAHSTDNHNTP